MYWFRHLCIFWISKTSSSHIQVPSLRKILTNTYLNHKNVDLLNATVVPLTRAYQEFQINSKMLKTALQISFAKTFSNGEVNEETNELQHLSFSIGCRTQGLKIFFPDYIFVARYSSVLKRKEWCWLFCYSWVPKNCCKWWISRFILFSIVILEIQLQLRMSMLRSCCGFIGKWKEGCLYWAE